MPRRTFIFDFDGTIADSLPEIIALYNRFAPQLGGRPIEPGDEERLRGKTTRGIMRDLGIPFRRLPFLLVKGRSLLHANIDSLGVVPAMREVLVELHRRGDRLMILTSNSLENVEAFLHRHDLLIFEDIRSADGLLGKHRILRGMLRLHRLEPATTLYMGDELRDVIAAKKIGIVSVAVTWGLNSRSALERKKPDVIVDEPGQLLGI